MKKQTIKRTATTALLIILVVATLLSISGFGQLTVTAADYIQEFGGDIVTNIQNYFDSNVLFKLPDTIAQDDYISVIVNLDNDAVYDAYCKTDKSVSFIEYAKSDAAEAIRKEIASEKTDILAALDEKTLSYTAGADYSAILSGFELVIQAKDFKALCQTVGKSGQVVVGEVYNAAESKLVENEVSFDESTGIFDVPDNFGYDGSGMLVAVLDTGLDYTHSAFSTSGFNPSKLAITKDEVAKLVAKTRAAKMLAGLSVDDVFVSDKVPFSFDYADVDSDVYSLHNNHGTHVSGVIVGKDDTIVGVAPNAQLVSMKIFSDVQDSARASWILSALEDCVILGVDVINMSLGTACGFSRESDEEVMVGVYEKIREMGISLVVAASNSFNSAYGSDRNGNLGLTSNPDTATVGSPSTYDGAMSVASINGTKTPYMLFNKQIIYFTEANNAATKERNFFDDILPDGADEMTVEFITIPGAGREADYNGIDVAGKVVLVERGFNTFEEKANAAEKNGAAGIIVYNNVSGDIKMNIGTSKIPICSVTQDNGELLAAAGTGKLEIRRSQTSGPFISDFSSWGPSPDLGIKPEITAHGGNILSAITGGGYDRLSGTSMACPNMAGVIALMRQYVMDKFPSIANDPVEVNARVNRLLMSTAGIMINTNGLPYAVRKQGAGLASLINATETPAYLLTYDRKDGSVMDKTKIELGDDPDKKGVYTLVFSVENFGSTALSYKLSAQVMTEGVADTKTNYGETTVNEQGYLLEGATLSFTVEGGEQQGNTLTVAAGATAKVTATVTLSDADKKYIDDSFENGMYVEGFICLEAEKGTEIDLNAPFLAFYGDWTKAPLFDLDYFETHADELNTSLDTLEKTLADAYATRPIGGVSEDYVSYLGSYYFVQDPASTKIISAKRDYIALSNVEGTIHSLRFVWAGLLRNAAKIVITITDDSTGEVVFTKVEEDVRKSYGDGGSIYPANVKIEFDTAEYNLKNNTEYTVKLVGYLDYGEDGGIDSNLKNEFEFPLVADFEAPAVTDCEFYTEYDKDAKKNRLFARIAVYDNHYAMAMQLGYVTGTAAAGFELKAFDNYLTPVYSERDGTTYVEYELTDHIYDIKNSSAHKNTFTVACYDYALNEATYEISLPDEFVDFYFEEEEIKLSPNEVYTLSPMIYPGTEWGELLQYTSTNTKVARIVNNKIVAVASGVSKIYARDPESGKTVEISLTVFSEDDPEFRYYDQPVADVFELEGYDTLKAFYQLATEDRKIGEVGDHRLFTGSYYNLSLYPSESVQVFYKLDAYFPESTKVEFESSNENIVTVSDTGVITAAGEGYASVTVKVMMNGRSTFYSESIDIEVKNPFITTAPALTHYFGNGGIVDIPADLLITEIGQYAFANFNYIPKTEDDEISEDDPDFTKIWYIGEDTITKVIIPEGVKKIGPYAFANLTALTEVVLPSTLEAIEYGAFFGCSSLKKVTGIENVQLINKDAFNGCNITGTLSLDNARAVGDYAFASNKNLSEIILPETLQSIGAYTFYGNAKLSKVTVKANKVKYGAYVFAECTSLKEITMNTNVIPTGAFNGSDALEKVTIGKDVQAIGEFAFTDTAITSFTVDAGNSVYAAQEGKNYLLSKDGKTLLLVAPRASGEFKLDGVTAVGKGAFSSGSRLTSILLKDVTYVDDYAFAYCQRVDSISLGKLTHIGDYAFYRTGITEAPAFDGISEIGDYAFAFTKLTKVVIPDGMVIGEGAFTECPEIREVVIGDNVTVGKQAFSLDRDKNSQLVRDPSFTDERYYSYEYISALTSLTVGKNANIGHAAFLGAASLTKVTLGEGATIGEQAFYNASSLKEIDLSKVISIGKNAFSGDQLYVYADSNQNSYAMTDDGQMVYKYYASALEKIDLSACTELGDHAFLYCKSLKEVKLGDKITVLPVMVFYECESLKTINLEKVVTVKDNALVKTAIEKADLSKATTIEKYAFVYCEKLTDLTLNPEGCALGEGAFAYCYALSAPKNLDKVTDIGAYAFAYTAILSADLSSAENIGDQAFLKEELTPFTVKLGASLKTLGDNPFAMCKLEPFASTVTESFNGKDYTKVTYTFDISETVHVIDGSLYCNVPNGLELTVFAGTDLDHAVIAEGTVRITAMAFAGSDIVRVTLPYTLSSIGHKAFFDCHKLALVTFTSFEAPNLEEEFDPTYYESYDHIPATGSYDFTMWDGTQVVKDALGIVPYYMWNVSDGKYSNVYYGANFVDYVGYNKNYIVMVKPVNGVYYDTFIYGKYFTTAIDGIVAAEDSTLAAIDAINKLPAAVTLEDEALVIAARAAYDKIATKDQQALVTNLSKLLSAEVRINALKGGNETPEDPIVDTDKKDGGKIALTVIVIVESVIIVAAAALVAVWYFLKKKKTAPETAPESEGKTEEATETVTEADAEATEVTEEAEEPKADDTPEA